MEEGYSYFKNSNEEANFEKIVADASKDKEDIDGADIIKMVANHHGHIESTKYPSMEMEEVFNKDEYHREQREDKMREKILDLKKKIEDINYLITHPEELDLKLFNQVLSKQQEDSEKIRSIEKELKQFSEEELGPQSTQNPQFHKTEAQYELYNQHINADMEKSMENLAFKREKILKELEDQKKSLLIQYNQLSDTVEIGDSNVN